jgi:hypothetical protein
MLKLVVSVLPVESKNKPYPSIWTGFHPTVGSVGLVVGVSVDIELRLLPYGDRSGLAYP